VNALERKFDQLGGRWRARAELWIRGLSPGRALALWVGVNVVAIAGLVLAIRVR
jgi:hypothetical protein